MEILSYESDKSSSKLLTKRDSYENNEADNEIEVEDDEGKKGRGMANEYEKIITVEYYSKALHIGGAKLEPKYLKIQTRYSVVV